MGKIKSDDKSAELHWIEEYFREINFDFVSDKANNILYFALIWNILEGKICNYKSNISAFEKFVTELENNNKIELS